MMKRGEGKRETERKKEREESLRRLLTLSLREKRGIKQREGNHFKV